MAPPGRATEGDEGPTESRNQQGQGGRSGNTTGGNGSQPSSGFALTFSLKYVRQEERKTATFDFRVNQAVDRTAAPQGSFKLLLDDLNIDNYIREVNLDDRFFSELRAKIGVAGDWERQGIEKVVINATYQPDPDGPIVHTDGWTFSESGGELKHFNVLLDKNRPIREYSYKTEIFLKDLAHIDSKNRVLEMVSTTEQRELIINPANEFEPLMVAVEPGIIDFEKVPRVDVKLVYDDPDNEFKAEQLFSFTDDQSGPFNWVLYPIDQERRSYSATFVYSIKDEDGTVKTFEVVDENKSDEGIIVPPPFRGVRRIRLIPAIDKESVQEIRAEVLYEKSGYRYHHDIDLVEQEIGVQEVVIPIPDPDPEVDSYKVRWSILFNDFNQFETDWIETQAGRVIMEDGVHWAQPVDIELLYSPADIGLRSLLMTIESLTPDGTVEDTDKKVFRGSESTWTTNLSYLKDTPFQYRLTKRWIKSDGTRETIGPFESSATELFVDERDVF